VLCPWSDLVATLNGFIRDGEIRPFKVYADDFLTMRDLQNAICELQIRAECICGLVLREMERREKLSQEDYENEWDATHARVMAKLEALLAAPLPEKLKTLGFSPQFIRSARRRASEASP
jgi:hypothetical protein